MASKPFMKKHFVTLLKILFAVGALYLVYTKIDIKRVEAYMQHTNMLLFTVSLLLLAVGQFISAMRMRYYFSAADIHISHFFSIALYWVGMFFNAILPGGIGGDGYKILLMSKLEQLPKLTSLRLALSNRASGLFLLLLFTFALAFSSDYVLSLPHSRLLLWGGLIGLIPSYIISIKLLLKESLRTAYYAAKYSFIIQGICLISGMMLFAAMGLTFHDKQLVINYLLIFMISSIASVLPITIGGFGLREGTFYYGTLYMGIDKELGIAFSFIYFIMNTLLSASGIIFVGKLPAIHYKHKQTKISAESSTEQ